MKKVKIKDESIKEAFVDKLQNQAYFFIRVEPSNCSQIEIAFTEEEIIKILKLFP